MTHKHFNSLNNDDGIISKNGVSNFDQPNSPHQKTAKKDAFNSLGT